MLRFAVIAETFAVVGNDDDRTRASHGLLERLEQSPELLVHRRDFAKVRLTRVLRAVRLGRRVRRVRIVVMDPQEEWVRGRRAQFADSRVGGVFGGALDP